MFEILELIKRGLLEVIYPRDAKCIICYKEDTEGICIDCMKRITPCNNKELCIGYYKGVLKELILQFKYNKNFAAGEVLVELIEQKIKGVEKEYYLTYIPMSKSSLKQRGFNQCKYIAEELGFRNDIDVIETLKKIKETKIQKTLSKQERSLNLKGSFALIDKTRVKSKKIIIVDDVITTGATLEEAIRVLKEGGAVQIKTLTLAKSNI